MGRRRAAYRDKVHNKKNNHGIIPDKMEIAVNINTYGVTQADFIRLSINVRYKQTGRVIETTVSTPNGISYQVVHQFIFKPKVASSYIQTSVICSHLNGNRAYREYYTLGAPKHLSTDGEDNFVSNEEVEAVIRSGGLSRYAFMQEKLPDLIFEEISQATFGEVCNIVVRELKGLTPKANVTTKMIDDHTFSFRLIEMANDFNVPKTYPQADGKLYDPTVDEGFLERLNEICPEKIERDWKTQNTYVAASSASYAKGRRQILFTLHDLNIEGKCYLKFLHGDEFDTFRVEPTYTSHHSGKKTDVLYKVAGRKSFNSPEQIKEIFYRLAKHTHAVTHGLFGGHYSLLTWEDKKVRVKVVLRPHFTSEQLEELVTQLGANHFKVYLPNVSYGTREKVKQLADEGHIFKCAKPEKSTGEYLFKRTLLGDVETRKSEV